MIYAHFGFLPAMFLQSGQFCWGFARFVLGEECRRNCILSYLWWHSYLLPGKASSQGGKGSASGVDTVKQFSALIHPVSGGVPPFLPGVFVGEVPARQCPFLLPWCGCEKGISEYYSRELDNVLFISGTMQPFSELNKHFTQQHYLWQYYGVPSFCDLSM